MELGDVLGSLVGIQASRVRVGMEREWTGPADGRRGREREVFRVSLLSRWVRVLPITDRRRTRRRNWSRTRAPFEHKVEVPINQPSELSRGQDLKGLLCRSSQGHS